MNINNTFTASVRYDLPFGRGKHFGTEWGKATDAALGHWRVNLIERALSGFPLFVVDSANTGPTFGGPPSPGNTGQFLNYNFFSFNRPVLVGDPNKGGDEGGQTGCPTQVHTLANWINPCAFAHAPAGEIGTAPRAPAYGPRFVNTDFSVMKDFPLREAMNLEFRAEIFNLFNHPQYFIGGLGGLGLVDMNPQPGHFFAQNFASVNQQVNNPRLVQFGLRLNF